MLDLRPLLIAIAQEDPEKLTKDRFLLMKRKFAKENNLSDVPSNAQLVRAYHAMLSEKSLEPNGLLESMLKKRGIRSESGIVSVQVLTKPFRCPGKCIFCPNDFTMPKSYINTEPGAMRALLNNFDPVKQVYNRLLSLTLTGHKVDKIEMIVLGGTWDVYPQDYKEEFIKSLYDACNTFSVFYEHVRQQPDIAKKFSHAIGDRENPAFPETIAQSQCINESADCRIIGLTIETRPEYVTDENCQFWRYLGVTRMEMGLQSLYDDVLDANKRGHSVQQAREAVHKLRQYGFKMSLHMMPGLYQSTVHKDIDSFRILYDDPYFKPDEIKFYPTSVIPNTELYDLYVAGEYVPLKTQDIKEIIREVFLHIIPPYTRIKRLIRDIPSTEIIAGSNVTNLSQLTHQELHKTWKNTPEAQELYGRLYGKDVKVFQSLSAEVLQIVRSGGQDSEQSEEGKRSIQTFIVGQEPDLQLYRNFVSLDTRSREIRHKWEIQKQKNIQDEQANLVIRKYRSSVGWEYFISFEDVQGYLYGLVRLLLPDAANIVSFPGLGKDTALIRELHVYGQLASIKGGSDGENKQSQHKGFGSQLMQVTEQICQASVYGRLSVIAGVGVKAYYRKLGYMDEGTYVVKTF